MILLGEGRGEVERGDTLPVSLRSDIESSVIDQLSSLSLSLSPSFSLSFSISLSLSLSYPLSFSMSLSCPGPPLDNSISATPPPPPKPDPAVANPGAVKVAPAAYLGDKGGKPSAGLVPAQSMQQAQGDPRFKPGALVEDAKVKVVSVTAGFPYFGSPTNGCGGVSGKSRPRPGDSGSIDVGLGRGRVSFHRHPGLDPGSACYRRKESEGRPRIKSGVTAWEPIKVVL